MKHTALSIFWLALCLACGDSASESAAEQQAPSASAVPDTAPPVDPAAPADKALAALMALPYAGYVEEDLEHKQLEGVLEADPERCAPGYTLVSVYSLGMALMVDVDGQVVHHWRASEPSLWDHVELLEGGELLTTGLLRSEKSLGKSNGKKGGAPARRYSLRLAWNGEVLWKQENESHHEISLAPDGSMVALTRVTRNAQVPESPSSGSQAERPKRRIRDNMIATFDRSGEITESVSIFDMLVADPLLFKFDTKIIQARKNRAADLIHANAIEWMQHPDLDREGPLYSSHNVVLSMRNQDRVAIFDLPRQKLLWEWGHGEISGPHDVQLLGNGNLLMLDNGVAQGRSRVVEVDPTTKSIAWQWQAPRPEDFFTPTKGSVQRLENGNTLVANADNGEVFELASNGDVVWRFLSPARSSQGERATLHRARRIPLATVDALLATHGGNTEWSQPNQESR